MHFDDDGLDLIEADIARESSTLDEATRALRVNASAIAEPLPASPTRVYLIGCGDSLDAGIAARFAWERLVDIPVEAVPAMTFATSVVDHAPEGSLVVALSQSGKVSRVVEGIRAARSRGLATATITANAGSPLAQEPSDASWVMEFEKLGAVPGTTSHLVGTVAMYELGCAMATHDEARDRLHAELDGLAELVANTVAGCGLPAKTHADAMGRDLPVLLLGYGPVLSSARFTVRKLLELTQLIALWQETEEYAHDEYSLVEPRFRVMQFAPPDRGRTRSGEVARYLNRLGVHLSVVTDGAESDSYEDVADVIYALPDCPASLVPLLYSIPGQLMSLATARRVGGSLYGMAEQVHREDGDPQIYESEIAVVSST
jgi:glucosamine 6-phosphate synthetase-like amidotransferase/phosphosugar isomerase protein